MLEIIYGIASFLFISLIVSFAITPISGIYTHKRDRPKGDRPKPIVKNDIY